jgi:hypothetical protein
MVAGYTNCPDPRIKERIKEREFLMTIKFRIQALDSDYLDRIRAEGVDDFGNSVVSIVNESVKGAIALLLT